MCVGVFTKTNIGPVVSSLYQCQSASEQSGQVFTPNIPDFYFTPENAARFRGDGGNLTQTENRGNTYIFTLPPLSAERNCSGTVLSLQYCFQARARDIGNTLSVFDWLSLTRDGNQFTVNARFAAPQVTPEEGMCANPPGGVQRVCCTTVSLASGRFQVPASAFTFGVVITNSNVRPLTFVDGVTEYDVESFIERPAGNPGPMPGDMFVGSSRTDHSLLLLRYFLLGKLIIGKE